MVKCEAHFGGGGVVVVVSAGTVSVCIVSQLVSCFAINLARGYLHLGLN